MNGPRAEWCDDTCVVCPAQALAPGEFDVVARPDAAYAYNPQIGWRVGPDGTAVCVHPYRVGMPPGRYASAGDPLPAFDEPAPAPVLAALELPAQLDDLEGWLVARLRVADSSSIFNEVARAERDAAVRFAPGEVVAALRRVLSRELTRH